MKPINLSTSEVLGILDGSKHQIVRAMKTKRPPDKDYEGCAPAREYLGPAKMGKYGAYFGWYFVPSPFAPGDTLYGKEALRWDAEWLVYDADKSPVLDLPEGLTITRDYIPSPFMGKEMARVFLRVDAVDAFLDSEWRWRISISRIEKGAAQ